MSTTPGVAHADQSLKEPEERNPEGPGEAAGSAAASGAAYSGPGLRNVIRGDLAGAKGAEVPVR